jgi:hypothetical protein
MRSRLPRFGSCLEKRQVFLLWIAERKLSMRAALVCLSCFVAWGFGFCRTGLWARPRPGALGGALAMPRKIWPGPMLPPPKFTGVAMGSCLPLGAGAWCRVLPTGVGVLRLETAHRLCCFIPALRFASGSGRDSMPGARFLAACQLYDV